MPPPPPHPSPPPPPSQTVDPPVVDLAVGVVHPLPPKLAADLNPIQRFLRVPGGVLLFGLIAFFMGTTPLISLTPVLFFLPYVSNALHWPVRRFVDLCTANWLSIVTLVYESLYGIKIRTFGHGGKFKRRSLSIMNHLSHMDWMYYWSVVDRHGDLSYWKPITKQEPLRDIPIIGHCMQMSCHLFINRDWKQDKKEFERKLYYFNAIDYPTEIFLFPEGGDFNPKRKAQSDQYADKNDLPYYQYCFHPRTKGFEYAITALRDGGLDAVYDITIAFPDVFPKTEIDAWRGVLPREVHFYIQEYEDKDIPEDQEELRQWLKDRWREKEERLTLFYKHGEFREVEEEEDGSVHHSNGDMVVGEEEVGSAHHSNGDSNQNGGDMVVNGSKISPEVTRPRNLCFLLYSLFFLLSTNFAVVFGLMYVPYFWVYMISGCLFLRWGGRRGLDNEFMEFKKKDIEAEVNKSRHKFKE